MVRARWWFVSALLLLALPANSCSNKKYVSAPDGLGDTPRFVVSPDSLVLMGDQPGTVYMTTDAPGRLSWRVTAKPSWASVSPESGSVTQSIAPVVIGANPSSLPPGSYEGTVTFLSTGGEETVRLFLQVDSHPILSASTTALGFTAGTSQRNLVLANSGSGLISWYVSGAPSWLQVSPGYGYLSERDSAVVSVDVNRAGLPVGTTFGSFTFVSNAENSPVTVNVVVEVTPAPVLEVSSDSLEIGYFENSAGFQVRNTGSGPLEWSAAPSDPAHVALDISSGTLAAGGVTNVVVTVDRSGLASGNFFSRIDVQATGGLTATVGVLLRNYVDPLWRLGHNVIDAEFDRAHGRAVTVSDGPPRLHVLDPVTQADTSVTLPLSPTCVAIRPDGLFAAVGHNGYVSIVDLTSLAVTRTYGVTCDAIDVVLPANGFVYVFPVRDQWTTLRCIELATGQETQSTGFPLRAGSLARLHPSGNFIYYADNGLSPSDFHKLDIQPGTANYLYDSPYHGDYSFGGNVWISEDGLRLFARSGNVFRSSPTRSEDMTYNGSLVGAAPIEWADHSALANRIVTVGGGNYLGEAPSELRVYDGTYLAFQETRALPEFLVPDGLGGGVLQPSEGHFAFFNSSGSKVFVLVRARQGSGLVHDWALATLDLNGLP